MEQFIWSVVPACVLIAGLSLARTSKTEKYGMGAIACASGFFLGPQCLCKDFAHALIGDLTYASGFGFVLLIAVLLLRASVLAIARKVTSS